MKKGNVQNKKFMLFSIIAFFAAVFGLFLIIPFNVKPVQTELDKVKASSGFTNIGTLANDYKSIDLEDSTIYMITSDLTMNYRINLKENSTAVIYVAAGCTLNAEYGITVPASSTLILVGDGTINAKGRAAEEGEAGVKGGDGERLNIGDDKDPAWFLLAGRPKVSYGPGGYPTADYAGRGGRGGRGASAGIGGASGGGGWYGSIIEVTSAENYILEAKDKVDDHIVGVAGRDGSNGADGGTMGKLYVLGNLTVNAVAGASSSKKGAGGAAGANYNYETSHWAWFKTHYHQHNAGGAGGGGGGGAGGPASNIGGGGAGGGGGGSGSTANCANANDTRTVPNCGGRGGGGGQSWDGSWAASGGSANVASNAAAGGSGGYCGSKGGDGVMYVQNYTSVSGRTRDYYSDGRLSQLQYTAILDRRNGSSNSSVSVYLGQVMDRVAVPINAGYSFQGYYTGQNGTGTKYFNSNGVASKAWDIVGDITLYAYWTIIPYSVELRPNGGSGNSIYVTAYYGMSMSSISSSSLPTRLGYNFQGYFTGTTSGDKYYNANGTSAKNWDRVANTVLYAHWQGKSYNVLFNSNFAPIQTSSQTGFYYGTPTALRSISAIGFDRKGYTFAGWSTTQNGGVQYGNGASVSTLNANSETVNLYAKWSGRSFSLNFNANGGSGTMSSQSGLIYGNGAAIKANSFVKTGYDFAGWALSPGGSVVFSNIETLKDVEVLNGVETDLSSRKLLNALSSSPYTTYKTSLTLYAKWTPKKYSITFNGNGSTSGTMSNQTLTYDSSLTLTTNAFKKENYLFKSWNTMSNGSGTTYYNNQSISQVSGNITLYAQWEETWNAHASASLSGYGTAERPYIIGSAADLAYISKMVDNGTSFSGVYFRQANSIDLAKNNASFVNWLWKPIGSETNKAFQGNYDGSGFLIKNLITSNARKGSSSGNYLYSNVGLFGYTRNATIKNVNIISGTIQGYDNVGSIVGNLNNGSVENCRSGATVTGHNYVGMIGYGVSTSILSSYNYGSVSGNDYVGGILGRNGGTGTRLENCYMKGSVTASASNADCGGILGQTTTSGITLQSCGFIGSVTGGSNTGLLTGNLNGGSVIDCFANSTTNYAFTKGSGTIKSSLYIQNKDNNPVKKYVTHSSETSPFANWTLAVNNQPLPIGFVWLGNGGEWLNVAKLISLGYSN
ncbi:MAG: InlB B-repeat-containing protein [Clostridia bacterium]|jgi:uncharacterized repeat protein (TIGR02543 family)|nr:InlB B-repeat-containing protein [Clostridia bacterium]